MKKGPPVEEDRPAEESSPPEKDLPAESAPDESKGRGDVVQWNKEWLAGNWQLVVDALGSAGQEPVAGVLGPARVSGLSNGVLTLEYTSDYDGLRKRGVEAVDDVNRALTALANMEITCNLVSSDGSEPLEPTPRVFGGLSSDEIAELSKDPSVKALTDSFSGSLLDARRDLGAGLAPDDDE
ncbi:MAG: hypothetical protein QGH94_06620 [Phycisphaerae bacterium]|nr:hypothetical protein [Phycisphaerae bacterium]